MKNENFKPIDCATPNCTRKLGHGNPSDRCSICLKLQRRNLARRLQRMTPEQARIAREIGDWKGVIKAKQDIAIARYYAERKVKGGSYDGIPEGNVEAKHSPARVTPIKYDYEESRRR